MSQLHKRFSDAEIRDILSKYEAGLLELKAAMMLLDVSRSRLFELLSKFREDPISFSVNYKRSGRSQLDTILVQTMIAELKKDKGLIENSDIPVDSYNYSAIRETLFRQFNRAPSVNTIITYAKKHGFHIKKRKKKIHDREVLTNYPGELVQHDSSVHLWSPYADRKWYLITSLDDFSRLLLHASFVLRETTWTHISALKSVVLHYGIPLKYYVDSLSVFRFVRERDSLYKKVVLKTDDIDPQWKQVAKELGIEVIYALSPQAKGKIERPYRWLQDHIVRISAKEHLTKFDDIRTVLEDETNQYNHHRIHSTTKEVPILRFENAQQQGRTLFRPFRIPEPYTSLDDIFCLREKRTVNQYRKLSFHGYEFFVPKVPPRHEAELRMVPNKDKGTILVRMWWKNQLMRELTLLIKDFPSVQF